MPTPWGYLIVVAKVRSQSGESALPVESRNVTSVLSLRAPDVVVFTGSSVASIAPSG